MFKPYIFTGFVNGLDSNKDCKEFSSYVEFKKNLKQLIENSPEKKITVHRLHKNKEGEWFEKWKMLGDKPIKIDEGWV